MTLDDVINKIDIGVDSMNTYRHLLLASYNSNSYASSAEVEIHMVYILGCFDNFDQHARSYIKIKSLMESGLSYAHAAEIVTP